MKVKYFLIAILGLLLFVAPAQAVFVLDFNMDGDHPDGANISYTDGTLKGSNIGVDSVLDRATKNKYTFQNAVLSFQTGSYTGGSGSSWNFGGGGWIKVEGPDDNNVNRVWLTGSFDGATVVPWGETFRVVIGSFLDVKNEILLGYLGIPTSAANYWFKGSMNLSFVTSAIPPNGFTDGDPASGNILNESTTSNVPIPPTVWLLGVGLVGLVGLRRKFRK